MEDQTVVAMSGYIQSGWVSVSNRGVKNSSWFLEKQEKKGQPDNKAGKD